MPPAFRFCSGTGEDSESSSFSVLLFSFKLLSIEFYSFTIRREKLNDLSRIGLPVAIPQISFCISHLPFISYFIFHISYFHTLFFQRNGFRAARRTVIDGPADQTLGRGTDQFGIRRTPAPDIGMKEVQRREILLRRKSRKLVCATLRSRKFTDDKMI